MFQEMSLLVFNHLGILTCKFSVDNNRRKDKETKKKKKRKKKRGESQHFPRDQLEQQTSRHMEKVTYLLTTTYLSSI